MAAQGAKARRPCPIGWLAAVVASLLGIWLEGSVFSSDHWQLTVAIYLVIYVALFMVMLRFGLVATIPAVFFVNSFQMIVIGLDWTTWYAPYGLVTLVFLLAIAFGAFWRSLGSQTLFGVEAAEGA